MMTAINEKLYDILVYMYSSDRWAHNKTWWDDIEVCYTKYTHTLHKGRIYGVVSVLEFSKFDKHLPQNKIMYMYLIGLAVLFS